MLSRWGNAIGIKPQRAKRANKNCIIEQTSLRRVGLFLHYILKHRIVKALFILWLQPPHSHTVTELSWTYWRISSKSKHITAVCSATGLSKWGTWLHTRWAAQQGPITRHNTGKNFTEEQSVQAVWKHLYLNRMKSWGAISLRSLNTLLTVPLTSSSSPQRSRIYAESFSHSLSVTDKRLALEKG